MESFKDEYDFIIVGGKSSPRLSDVKTNLSTGGTSGSVLASRLSRTPSAPKVLLLEGGGLNHDPTLRSTDKRWNAFLTEPLMNWGYMSVPQNQLVGQQIPCARGRGLGGSSAINFSNWLVGHREDFNLWADKVDDPSWKWDGDNGVKQRLRKIENLRPEVEPEYEHIIDTEAQKLHSANGVVDVGFKQHWSENEVAWFNAAKEFGMDINGDINSGDPTGFGLCSYFLLINKRFRVTDHPLLPSSTMYLQQRSSSHCSYCIPVFSTSQPHDQD
jgi:choline dehydrogenase-like flavoprotein